MFFWPPVVSLRHCAESLSSNSCWCSLSAQATHQISFETVHEYSSMIHGVYLYLNSSYIYIYKSFQTRYFVAAHVYTHCFNLNHAFPLNVSLLVLKILPTMCLTCVPHTQTWYWWRTWPSYYFRCFLVVLVHSLIGHWKLFLYWRIFFQT